MRLKALVIRFLLISGAFFLLCNQAFSGYNYNENCRQCYQAIISLQFGEARRLIEREKKTDPQNLIPVYLDNYIDCLSVFLSEDPALFRYLEAKKSVRVSKLEKGPENSPFHRFCLAQVHLQWAFARLKFDEYGTAANEIRKAYNLLKANDREFPGFSLNKTGLGIIHVALGLIPDNYRWLTGLLGLKGTMLQGIGEIHQIAWYPGNDVLTTLYKPEAAFYLAFITLNLRQNRGEWLDVLQLLDILETRMLTPSPLLIYARASILMKTGKNGEALIVLAKRRTMTHRFPFLYLDYLEGVSRLNNLDFTASANFDLFLQRYKGRNYILAANQRLSWIAFLQGDTVQYRKILNKMSNNLVLQVDEDKQIARQVQSGAALNYHLLRARLLFDGGYYGRALDELLHKPAMTIIKTKKDMIEYVYRLGRIQQEIGNIPVALGYLQQAIELGKSQPYYFAASAALQIGIIYENKMEWLKAGEAYRLSLSIETPEYTASLRQKAKAGLARVTGVLKPDPDGG